MTDDEYLAGRRHRRQVRSDALQEALRPGPARLARHQHRR